MASLSDSPLKVTATQSFRIKSDRNELLASSKYARPNRRQIVGWHSSPFLGPFWRPRNIPWKQRNWGLDVWMWCDGCWGQDTDRTTRKVGKVDRPTVIAEGRQVGLDVQLQQQVQTAVCRDQLMSCCCSDSLRPTRPLLRGVEPPSLSVRCCCAAESGSRPAPSASNPSSVM